MGEHSSAEERCGPHVAISPVMLRFSNPSWSSSMGWLLVGQLLALLTSLSGIIVEKV